MAATLADDLWTARLEGKVIALAPEQEPASVAAAYAVQAAMIGRAGLAQIGWKIGATTKATQALLAVDEPFIGPLFAPHCHQNGARVSLMPAHRPGVESEFLLGLAADLPPREKPYDWDEAAAAVGFVAPAFEIVGCRFEGGLAGKGVVVIADGGGNAAMVQGEPLRDWRRLDLRNHAVRLRVNGAEVASGNSGDLVFGDPIGAIAWLAAQPALAGRGLKRGDLVMTGTCTGLTPVTPGDEAVADFGALGRVRARFA